MQSTVSNPTGSGVRGGFKASCRKAFRLCWEALSPGLLHIPAIHISGSCPQALTQSWLLLEARAEEGLNMGFQASDHSGLLFPLGCLESVQVLSVSVSVCHLPRPSLSLPTHASGSGPKGPFLKSQYELSAVLPRVVPVLWWFLDSPCPFLARQFY